MAIDKFGGRWKLAAACGAATKFLGTEVHQTFGIVAVSGDGDATGLRTDAFNVGNERTDTYHVLPYHEDRDQLQGIAGGYWVLVTLVEDGVHAGLVLEVDQASRGPITDDGSVGSWMATKQGEGGKP